MRNNLGRLLTEVDDVYVLETIPQVCHFSFVAR